MREFLIMYNIVELDAFIKSVENVIIMPYRWLLVTHTDVVKCPSKRILIPFFLYSNNFRKKK